MVPFVAAAVQVAPVPGPLTPESVKANLDSCVDHLQRCVDATGAELVVLPETATTGFSPAMDAERLWDLGGEVPGPLTEPIQEATRRLGVHAVLGTYERGPPRGEGDNTRAAVGPGGGVVGPGGEVLGAYRKTHLFCGEDRAGGGWVTPGDRAVVVDTGLAKIGLIICFNGDYPDLARAEAGLGAE